VKSGVYGVETIALQVLIVFLPAYARQSPGNYTYIDERLPPKEKDGTKRLLMQTSLPFKRRRAAQVNRQQEALVSAPL
jgi:hypothetical protein